jgi:hypothetical protein
VSGPFSSQACDPERMQNITQGPSRGGRGRRGLLINGFAVLNTCGMFDGQEIAGQKCLKTKERSAFLKLGRVTGTSKRQRCRPMAESDESPPRRESTHEEGADRGE